MHLRLATTAILLAGIASPLRAQLPEYRNVLSANPIGIVFEVISAEYERALSASTSLAAAGTLWNSSQTLDDGSDETDVTYLSTDLKLRYYPGTALRGFAIGAMGGFSLLDGEVRSCQPDRPCEQDGGRVFALSTGVTMDYAWRLGEEERFFMALGWGAKRLFPTEDDVDATLAYPFLRFNVGWVF